MSLRLACALANERVARLVELMQGHIETVTEPGKGTKITVTLPSLQG